MVGRKRGVREGGEWTRRGGPPGEVGPLEPWDGADVRRKDRARGPAVKTHVPDVPEYSLISWHKVGMMKSGLVLLIGC